MQRTCRLRVPGSVCLSLSEQAVGEFDVEIDALQQLGLADVFVGGVGDEDAAGAEQEGLAPVGERGDVGGELGDHGVEAGDRAHVHVGELEGEVDLAAAGGGCEDLLLEFFGRADEADEDVGLGFVGDDVGSDAAADDADVHGAVADAFDYGQREGLDVVERGEELVDGGVAELGVGGVGHLAVGAELDAETAFGGEGEAVVGGLAVDDEARAVGGCVGDEGAGGVALFADDVEQSDALAGGASFSAAAIWVAMMPLASQVPRP